MVGANLKAKATSLETMRLPDALALAERIGFAIRASKGDLVVIPAGYIYIVAVGPSGTEGLRWGYSRPVLTQGATSKVSDDEIVKTTLTDMLESYPDHKKTEMGKFFEFMKSLK